jgi:hypothetical protein
MSEINDVRAAMQKRAEAMVAGDIEAIAGLLEKRLIYTHSSGLVDTRESYIEALNRREYVYHSVEPVSIDHSIVDRDSVILNSIMEVAMTVRSTGQSLSRRIRVTEIWTRDAVDLTWRLLVSHSTNVA